MSFPQTTQESRSSATVDARTRIVPGETERRRVCLASHSLQNRNDTAARMPYATISVPFVASHSLQNRNDTAKVGGHLARTARRASRRLPARPTRRLARPSPTQKAVDGVACRLDSASGAAGSQRVSVAAVLEAATASLWLPCSRTAAPSLSRVRLLTVGNRPASPSFSSAATSIVHAAWPRLPQEAA